MKVMVTELFEEWRIQNVRNPELLDMWDSFVGFVKNMHITERLENMVWRGERFFPVENTKNIGMLMLDKEIQQRMYFLKKGGSIFFLFGCDENVKMIEDKFVFEISDLDKMIHTRPYEPFDVGFVLKE